LTADPRVSRWSGRKGFAIFGKNRSPNIGDWRVEWGWVCTCSEGY